VGGLFYIGSILGIYALRTVGVSDYIAYGLVQLVIFICGYFANKYFVFNSTLEYTHKEFGKYTLVSFVGRIFSWFVFSVILYFDGSSVEIAVFLSLLAIIPLKYLLFSKWVFGYTTN